MVFRILAVLLCLSASGLEASTFTVTSTSDSGPGSLRQAIADANASAGTDTIAFAIATVPRTISISTSLTVSDPVVIDGGTLIEIRPTGSTEFDGLVLAAGSAGSVVRALKFSGFDSFPDRGIALAVRSNDNSVTGCHFADNDTSIEVRGNTNVVGGVRDEDRNVIGGGVVGISIPGAHNSISGNYIGTDAAGVTGRPLQRGIEVSGGNNTIGGSHPASGNVIGMATHAIFIHGMNVPRSWVTTLQGNSIGIGPSGTSLPNMRGVAFSNAGGTFRWLITNNLIANNDIGIACCQGAGTISGNTFTQNNYGIATLGTATTIESNEIFGNEIGIFTRTYDTIRANHIHDNRQHGIQAWGWTTMIGGSGPADGNVIRQNGGAGIVVADINSNVTIRRNSISDNAALGIDLQYADSGVTPNDPDDADVVHGNRGQNFPILTQAVSVAAGTVVSGTLHSYPSSTFTLEFFSVSSTDATGHGEGDAFLGDLVVTSDPNGNATFTATLPRVTPGRILTATATGPWGTSEFSRNMMVAAGTGADLIVSVDAPPAAFAGGELIVTAHLTNLGPDAATSPQLLVTLPTALSFVETVLTGANPMSCAAAGGVVACNLSALAAGASADAAMRLRTAPQSEGTLTIFARAESATSDPHVANNVANASTKIEALPGDLAVSIVATPPAVAEGGRATIAVRIRNHGPGDARSVVLSVDLSDNVTLERMETPQGECAVTGDITCSIPLLQANADVTVTLSLLARTAGTATLSASAAAAVPDADPRDNTASAVLSIVKPRQRSVRH